MRTHVALLRGVNVGGHNRLPMADLRRIVESLGHDDVATYIQSDNVVFGSSETDPERLAATLEHAIADSVGVRPGVVVLSRSQLESVVADNPYPQEDDPKRLHVVLHRAPISPDAAAVVTEAEQRARDKGSRDEATVLGSSLYLRTPDGLGRSVLADLLTRGPAARTHRAVTTMRNWATVTALVALLGTHPVPPAVPQGSRTPVPSGPAVLVPHQPDWAVIAAERLAAVREALGPLVDVGACAFDHIGSSAVPGLAAKPFVDLQVRVPAMPEPGTLDAALAPLGWAPAPGSRPDSPGVHRDVPAPGDAEPAEVWAKRLFTSTDPASPAILHVRLVASPFGRRTVALRDRLRAESELRAAYERLKRDLAAEHAGAPDYDDYTRGKTAFIRAATST